MFQALRRFMATVLAVPFGILPALAFGQGLAF